MFFGYTIHYPVLDSLSNKKLKKVLNVPRLDNQERVVFCLDEKGSAIAYTILVYSIPAVGAFDLDHLIGWRTGLFCVSLDCHVVVNVASKVREFAISYFCVSHKDLLVVGYTIHYLVLIKLSNKKVKKVIFCSIS